MRFSLVSFDHTPSMSSSKSLEISFIQKIYKCVLIGIRGLTAYYLFLSPFKLNGNVINTYIKIGTSKDMDDLETGFTL